MSENSVDISSAGAKVADLCRKYGMSDATYYNWKVKYAGLTVIELKRLALEDENRRLKQIVANQVLDIRALSAFSKALKVSIEYFFEENPNS